MKAISAKASFSDKAKQLFKTEAQTREVISGVFAVRLNEGVRSFKTGKFTVSTDRSVKKD